MKKILALILALCMVLSLAACGGTAEKPAEAPAAEAPAAEAPAAEAPAAEEPAAEEPAAEEPAAEEPAAEEPAAEEPAAEEPEVKTAELPDFEDSDLVFSLAPAKLDQDFEKDMVRGDDVQASDISKCPATKDRAAYQKDGRLQLTSGDLKVLFTIPFGWMVFTQDAMGQREDYEMVRDPAGLVTAMQAAELNAVAITDNMEELDMMVMETGFSQALVDTDYISYMPDSTVKELADAIKQGNPGVTDVYFSQIGNSIYMVLEVESANTFLFLTVRNSVQFSLSYTLSNTTTQDDFNEVLDFLAGLEFSAA